MNNELQNQKQELSILDVQNWLGDWADGKLEVLPHGVYLSADRVSVRVKCLECNKGFTDVLGDHAGYLGVMHWNENHKN